jgi:hypothetical protein
MLPEAPQSASPASPPPVHIPPRGLSGVIGITIALGVLAILSAIMGLGSIALSKQLEKPLATLSQGETNQATRNMLEMQTSLREASLPVPATILALIGLPLAVWLLISVRGVSRRAARATVVLERAITALAVLEIGTLVLQIVVQLRIRPIMAKFTQNAFTANPAIPAGAEHVATSVMQIVSIIGVIVGIGWCVGKIAACLYIRSYARKPEVRAWMAEG